MYNFNDFLQELSSETDIKFKLVSEEGIDMFNSLESIKASQCITTEISLGKQNAKLITEIEKENCTSLLKYTIERKYSEFYYLKEQLIVDLLEGKGVAAEVVDNTLPFLLKGSTLFLISVGGSLYEALSVLKQLYMEENAVTIIYRDSLLMIGNFEEVEEHAKSIKDAITSDLYSKCYISYANVPKDTFNLKSAYEDAKECLVIGRKYDIKDQIFDSESMIFERAIYNINPKAKKELLDRFQSKFNLFDQDIINTIEEFVRCGLNISEAAKNLYIHRNTLIYRLDKISKDTGYDIRDFRQAAIFIIAFLIWKESR